MKIARAVVAALAVLLLAGCIQTVTTVKVNKDGSGTVEETVLLSKSLLEMLKNLGQPEEEQQGLASREELEQKAANMGEGVELVSSEQIENEQGSGYKAVFSFRDINTLRINQNPGENVPNPNAEEQEQVELVTFHLSPGRTATLDVFTPPPQPAGAEQEEQTGEGGPAAQDNPEMMEMLRELYKDMKIALYVEVNGSIVDTNATYREGSTVTLLDMDFGKLMEDEKAFQSLVKEEPNSLEELKEIVKNNPGIKAELQDQVSIRFR